MPIWGIVPPLGALNWWSRTSAQLATSPCNYTLNSGKTLDRWAKSIPFLVSPLLRQNQQVQPSSRRSILIPSGPAEILTIGNDFSIIVSEIWGLLRGAGFSRRPEIPQHAGSPLGLARSTFVVAVVPSCLCPLPDYELDMTGRLTVPSAHHAARLPCSPLSGQIISAVPYRRTLAEGND